MPASEKKGANVFTFIGNFSSTTCTRPSRSYENKIKIIRDSRSMESEKVDLIAHVEASKGRLGIGISHSDCCDLALLLGRKQNYMKKEKKIIKKEGGTRSQEGGERDHHLRRWCGGA